MLMLQALSQSILPFALVMNPNTGDRNATILWIVIATLVVSAGVIAAMILSSRNTKKKKRRK